MRRTKNLAVKGGVGCESRLYGVGRAVGEKCNLNVNSKVIILC